MASTATQRTSPQEWIELLVRQGRALREAGITRLVFGECVVEISPLDPILKFEEAAGEEADAAEPVDPVDDPATYGGDLPTPRGRR